MQPTRFWFAVGLFLTGALAFSLDQPAGEPPHEFISWFPELNSELSFTIPDDVSSALKFYPQSAKLLEDYRVKNAWGSSLVSWGIPVWLTGMILYVTSIELNPTPNHYNGYIVSSIGVVAVGLGMAGTGIGLLPASYDDLTHAIRTYNDLTFKRLMDDSDE